MPLSDHVNLTITFDTVGITRAGFGTVMILSNTAAWTERTRTYNSAADVLVDFAVTTPEYLAAVAAFSQSPAVQRVKIGRAALPATQVYVLGIQTVRNNEAKSYSVNVKGAGVTSTAVVPVASGGSATNDAICALLVTALNAVVGKNYTAAATGTTGSQVVTVTATSAGAWFSIEVLDLTGLNIKQTHADPGVATDLAAIAVSDPDWYALSTMYNSNAYVVAAAAWVETNNRIYIVDSCDSAILTATATGSADVADNLKTLGYARTMIAYHVAPAAMMANAWMGRCLPIDPGGETWKFKQLAGVAAVFFTATYRANLIAKRANSVQLIGNLTITFEGTCAAANTFMDTIRGLDWIRDDMPKGVFSALASANKLAYEDQDITAIEAEIRSSLRRATGMHILAANPPFVITIPQVSAAASADKLARILRGLKWSATLSGAVHNVQITGVVQS